MNGNKYFMILQALETFLGHSASYCQQKTLNNKTEEKLPSFKCKLNVFHYTQADYE